MVLESHLDSSPITERSSATSDLSGHGVSSKPFQRHAQISIIIPPIILTWAIHHITPGMAFSKEPSVFLLNRLRQKTLYPTTRTAALGLIFPLCGHLPYLLDQLSNRQIWPLFSVHRIDLSLRIESMLLIMLLDQLSAGLLRCSIHACGAAVEGTGPDIAREERIESWHWSVS